jgi:hypothetical protein
LSKEATECLSEEDFVQDRIGEGGQENPEVETTRLHDSVLPLGRVALSKGSGYFVNETLNEISCDYSLTTEIGIDGDDTRDTTAAQAVGIVSKTNLSPLENQQDDNDIDVSPHLFNDYQLPGGWVEIFDPDSGLPYYFHETTNETSWDRPTKRLSDVPPPAQSSLADVFPDGETHSDEVLNTEKSDDSNIPPGWVSVTDHSTGSSYFFHAASNTTSWDVPLSDKPTELGEDASNDFAEGYQNSEHESEGVVAPILRAIISDSRLVGEHENASDLVRGGWNLAMKLAIDLTPN